MNNKKNYVNKYFFQIAKIASLVDRRKIDQLVIELVKIKKKSGRIFFLGFGGSAGN